MTIRQIISDNRGYLVALKLNGELYRQERDPNATSFVVEWQPVDLEGLDGRVVQVTVRHDDRLVIMLADGRVYEDVATGIGEYGRRKWREVAMP